MIETKKIDEMTCSLFMTPQNLLIGEVADALDVYGVKVYKTPNANNDYLVACKRKDLYFPISCDEKALLPFAKDAFNIK